MGALTFQQMQTLVKRTINNRDDLDTEIAQAINQAYRQVCALRGVSFRELDQGPGRFSTVAAQRFYPFASTTITTGFDRGDAIVGGIIDPMAIFSPMRDRTNSRRIKASSVQDFDGKFTTSGKPYWFAHTGDGIELEPTPDAVYSIQLRWRLRPNQLSNAPDVTVIPPEFDWVVVWGAAADINATIGVLDRSSFYSTKRREALELITTSEEVEDAYADFALAPDLS
jgi:hypothetical protein